MSRHSAGPIDFRAVIYTLPRDLTGRPLAVPRETIVCALSLTTITLTSLRSDRAKAEDSLTRFSTGLLSSVQISIYFAITVIFFEYTGGLCGT